MIFIRPICIDCKNYNLDKGNCKAFEEIPDEIYLGDNKHTKPLKGQKNNIVFEPIKKQK